MARSGRARPAGKTEGRKLNGRFHDQRPNAAAKRCITIAKRLVVGAALHRRRAPGTRGSWPPIPMPTCNARTGLRDPEPPESEQSHESDESHGLDAGDQAARTEVAIRSVSNSPPRHTHKTNECWPDCSSFLFFVLTQDSQGKRGEEDHSGTPQASGTHAAAGSG